MTGYEEVLESIQQLSPEEQEQLRRELETLAHVANTQALTPKKNRTPGLNRGQFWVSDDFNDLLPDEYLGIAS